MAHQGKGGPCANLITSALLNISAQSNRSWLFSALEPLTQSAYQLQAKGNGLGIYKYLNRSEHWP